MRHRPGFGQPMVVKNDRARPQTGQPLPGRRNASARLARHNNHANIRFNLVSDPSFAQPHRIRRRAAQYSGPVLRHRLQPRRTRQPAARHGHQPHAQSGLKSRPKPQKWTKGESKKDTIPARNHPRRLIHPPPTPEHGRPIFRSIKPRQRTPSRTTGLTKPSVALQRPRQICAIRRISLAVSH